MNPPRGRKQSGTATRLSPVQEEMNLKKRFGIFLGVSGVLVCLLLGIALYRRSMSAPEISMAAIPTENLQISENQNAYPSSNLGVSILGTEEFDVREEIEFSVENNSGQDWFWEPNIEVGRILLKDEEHKSKEDRKSVV